MACACFADTASSSISQNRLISSSTTYAISGSVVVRSIRKLDGHRSTPLVLKSLRLSKEKYIGACSLGSRIRFHVGFCRSRSMLNLDSIISQESIPFTYLLPSISEFDEHDISQYLSKTKLRNWKIRLRAIDPRSGSIIQHRRTSHFALPLNNRLWTRIMRH